jgi:hypothetical protein
MTAPSVPRWASASDRAAGRRSSSGSSACFDRRPGMGPGGIEFGWGALLALISAFTYAITLITSRQLSRTELSHTILFYYSIAVILVTGATLPFNWITPSWADLWIFLLVGVVGRVGQSCLTRRSATRGLVHADRYTGLLWGRCWRDFGATSRPDDAGRRTDRRAFNPMCREIAIRRAAAS